MSLLQQALLCRFYRRMEKVKEPWTQAHQVEATEFYLNNYIQMFNEPDVAAAYAAIPSVNVWDDHDIWHVITCIVS
jgi:phosphodiesterase/alkaline phosphatase D-like protein